MESQPVNPAAAEPGAPAAGRMPAERRRVLMLDGAREVFSRAGFAGARTRDIAEAAGVTEAMLFRYFDSKEQLFEEAVAVPLQEAVTRTVARSLPVGGQPRTGAGEDFMRERSRELFRDLLEAMHDMAPLLGVVLFADSERGGRYYTDHLEPSFDQLRLVILENLPAWRHRDFDPDVIVRSAFAQCWMFALDARLGTGDRRSSDELADELVTLLFDGIGAPSPQEGPDGARPAR